MIDQVVVAGIAALIPTRSSIVLRLSSNGTSTFGGDRPRCVAAVRRRRDIAGHRSVDTRRLLVEVVRHQRDDVDEVDRRQRDDDQQAVRVADVVDEESKSDRRYDARHQHRHLDDGQADHSTLDRSPVADVAETRGCHRRERSAAAVGKVADEEPDDRALEVNDGERSHTRADGSEERRHDGEPSTEAIATGAEQQTDDDGGKTPRDRLEDAEPRSETLNAVLMTGVSMNE